MQYQLTGDVIRAIKDFYRQFYLKIKECNVDNHIFYENHAPYCYRIYYSFRSRNFEQMVVYPEHVAFPSKYGTPFNKISLFKLFLSYGGASGTTEDGQSYTVLGPPSNSEAEAYLILDGYCIIFTRCDTLGTSLRVLLVSFLSFFPFSVFAFVASFDSSSPVLFNRLNKRFDESLTSVFNFIALMLLLYYDVKREIISFLCLLSPKDEQPTVTN